MRKSAMIKLPEAAFAPVPLAPRPQPVLVVAPAPSQDVAPPVEAPRIGERIGFQIPARIWATMFACYGLFFAGIIAATGEGGHARFAIVISILYTGMYFGMARILSRLAGKQPDSPLDTQGRADEPVLQTCYGPMNGRAVAAQILIVPIALVIFAVGFLIVRMIVMP